MENKEKINMQIEFGMRIHELCDEYGLSNKLTSAEMFALLSYEAHALLHK